MNQTTAYIAGIIIIGLGLRIIYKGYVAKSRARMLLGAAAVPAAVAVCLGKSPVAMALLGLGVVLYLASLVVLRKDVAAGRVRLNPRRQNLRRRRR